MLPAALNILNAVYLHMLLLLQVVVAEEPQATQIHLVQAEVVLLVVLEVAECKTLYLKYKVQS